MAEEKTQPDAKVQPESKVTDINGWKVTEVQYAEGEAPPEPEPTPVKEVVAKETDAFRLLCVELMTAVNEKTRYHDAMVGAQAAMYVACIAACQADMPAKLFSALITRYWRETREVWSEVHDAADRVAEEMRKR